MEVGFSGLEVYGFAHGVNRAFVSGQTVIEDYSNGTMAYRFLGEAMNWPFVPAKVNIHNDQQWCSGDFTYEYPCRRKIPEITDPFTGKKYGIQKSRNNTTKKYPIGPSSLFMYHLSYLNLRAAVLALD